MNYPDAGLDKNYCRNPDGSPTIWCYTKSKDKRKRRQDCKPIEPKFGKEECEVLDKKCEKYEGRQNRTVNGLTCQAWDKQTPHKHKNTPSERPKANLE